MKRKGLKRITGAKAHELSIKRNLRMAREKDYVPRHTHVSYGIVRHIFIKTNFASAPIEYQLSP